MWTLTIGAPTGDDSGSLLFNVYDKITGDVTTTVVDDGENWGLTEHLTVTFTQTAWQVYQDGASAGTGSCNFADVYSGFSFNGLNVPYAGLSGYCFNGTIQDIAIYPLTLPQPRITAHYNVRIQRGTRRSRRLPPGPGHRVRRFHSRRWPCSAIRGTVARRRGGPGHPDH